MITVTERALKQLCYIVKKASESSPVIGMRFGVKAGGCSGFEYILEAMERTDARENDYVLHLKELRIYINAKSIPLVWGTEIDHSYNLLEGFIFHNPHAKTSCGCGVSFELKDT